MAQTLLHGELGLRDRTMLETLYSTGIRRGIQLTGLVEICLGLYVLRKQQVPYGWRGRAPGGYIRGIPAIAVGLAVVGFGIDMLLSPETVAVWASRH